MAELPSGTLTFLLTDVAASTRRWESQPRAMRKAMARHDEIFGAQVPRHQGSLVESGKEGDSVLAVFTRASDAVACALDLQRDLRRHRWPPSAELRVRMALHSGEAELRAGHYVGPALYRCARLLEVGHGGQVLVSQAAQDLVIDALPPGAALFDLGVHRLRDLSRPERVFQLLHADLEGRFPPLRSLASFRHNLPLQLTSFVGRGQELAEVKRLLETTRLLTLTGVGGTGKTRLALQAAADLLDDYRDGVWLVELGRLQDPALLAQTLADTLGLAEGRPEIEPDAIAAWLTSKQLLMLLDSCEHVAEAAAELSEGLLSRCEKLRILTTSRQALKVMGEVVWPVSPMALTAREGGPSEAVSLFSERAQSSRPGFVLGRDNLPSVIEICERLDGLPLAIELAAARVSMMSPGEILKRLDDRFRLLAVTTRVRNPRHRTLRTAVDWSHHLLSEPERILFARLSVFVGGFDLEAAETVCSGGAVSGVAVLDLVSQLIDKSLAAVRPGAEGGTRYALLETLREYGYERLTERGEVDAIRRRHAEHYLVLAEAAAPELWRAGGLRWIRRLEEDHDNLRAAFEVVSPEGELRLAAVLSSFWYARGYLSEGRARLATALAKSSHPSRTRAAALRGCASLAWSQGDQPAAAAYAGEGLTLSRQLGDSEGVVLCLEMLGRISLQREDFERARCYLDEAIGLARELQNPWLIGQCLFRIGMMAMQQSDLQAAEDSLQASAALGRESGNQELVFVALGTLGHLEARRGRYQQARSHLSHVLSGWRGQASRRHIAYLLESCALVAAATGQPVRAMRLSSAAAALRRQIGAEPTLVFQRDVEEKLGSALSRASATAARAEGDRMSMDEAIDYALSEEMATPVRT